MLLRFSSNVRDSVSAADVARALPHAGYLSARIPKIGHDDHRQSSPTPPVHPRGRRPTRSPRDTPQGVPLLYGRARPRRPRRRRQQIATNPSYKRRPDRPPPPRVDLAPSAPHPPPRRSSATERFSFGWRVMVPLVPATIVPIVFPYMFAVVVGPVARETPALGHGRLSDIRVSALLGAPPPPDEPPREAHLRGS